MFGFLKNSVYKDRLHTIEELQNAITNKVRSITEIELQNVFENMKRRVQRCIENNGGHFEHFL